LKDGSKLLPEQESIAGRASSLLIIWILYYRKIEKFG
jgi:hypothetical protein